jgi:tetratricopeptide (TPR) repeat protein
VSQGKFKQALASFEQCLALQVQAHGPTSPVLSSTLENLRKILRRLRLYQDEIAFYEWLVRVRVTNRDSVASVASDVNKISAWYSSNLESTSDHEELMSYCQTRLTKYGVVDVDLANTCTQMAAACETEGNLDDAVQYLEMCLNLQIAARNTIDAAKILTQYARIRFQQGRTEDALVLIEDSLQYQRTGFGKQHESMIDNLLLGARAYKEVGNYARSLEYFLRHLEIAALADPSSTDEHVDVREAVIELQQALGRFDETVEHIERVHFAKTGQHIGLSDAAALLAHLKTQEFNTLGHHKHILHLQTIVLGATHVESLASRVRIGQMLEKSGRLRDAVKHLNESILLGDTPLKEEFEKQLDRITEAYAIKLNEQAV